MKKYKIGSFIKIKPENIDCTWYTDEIFQILSINEKKEIYIISIKLKTIIARKNTIYFGNVYQNSDCLKMERQNKINKLNNL